MKQPLVSVLMPCYNAEQFVEESMQSILGQTYQNMEIIAINDCSTDNTLAILNNMAKEDSRIKVVTNLENLKLIRTLNKGVTLCSGEYIARMDSDDIALPTRIEKEVAFLEANSDHDIVSTQFHAFRSDNPRKLDRHCNPTRDEDMRAYILFKSGICHPAVMIRQRVFTELGLSFGAEYLHVEDYALWSEAIYKTKIANLAESLLHYRVHDQQVSVLNEQLQVANKKKVFKIHCHHLGLPTDDHFLDTYLSVAEANPVYNTWEHIDECENLMLRLLELNKAKPFCNQQYLIDMLSMHWIRLCANSQLGLKAVSRAKKSILYKGDNYQNRDLFILYAKCLFKLKYKDSYIYKLIFK